jgi:nucleoside-triphosphatase THEP1
VGRYGVAPDRLIPLIDQELVRPPETVDAYLIDEIGKMECHC